MTKKTPKPTAQHMQKLADLMDTRPEGVTVQRVQDTLQVSPTLAKAALIEIGATEVEGKWVFELEPVTIAESAPVEPVTIAERNASLNAVLMPSTQGIGHLSVYGADIDWSKAPDGATHYRKTNKRFYKRDCGAWFFWTDLEMAWKASEDLVALSNEALIPRPEADFDMGEWGIQNFQKECQRVADQQAKSDFALALEAERQRVYDAVANGGTVERIAELTGLHVDDVQMHLDVLIDDGAVVERPVIVAMSYRVAV